MRTRDDEQELPAEFFLPPQSDSALRRETAALICGAVLFIIVLAVIVSLTQGIVVEI